MANDKNRPVVVSVFGSPNKPYEVGPLIVEAAKRADLALPLIEKVPDTNDINASKLSELKRADSEYANMDILLGKLHVSSIQLKPEASVPVVTSGPEIAVKPTVPETTPMSKPVIAPKPMTSSSTPVRKPTIAPKPKVPEKGQPEDAGVQEKEGGAS